MRPIRLAIGKTYNNKETHYIQTAEIISREMVNETYQTFNRKNIQQQKIIIEKIIFLNIFMYNYYKASFLQ